MANPPKRRKRKRKDPARADRATRDRATGDAEPSRLDGVSPDAHGGGGGFLQGMRASFQRAAGGGEEAEKDKPSTLSNVLWTIVLLGAAAFALYRWYG